MVETKNLLISVSSLFVFIQYFLLFALLKRLTKNNFIAVLMVFVSFVFIYSSSTLFSPTMIVSSLSIILLFLSGVVIVPNQNFTYFLSGIFLLFSLLTYEITIFTIPLICLLFYDCKYGNRDLLSRIFFILLVPVFLSFIYKNYIGGLIFEGYQIYTDKKVNIGIINVFEAVISILKTFCIDTFVLMKNAIGSIKHFRLIDYMIAILGIVTSFLLVSKLKKINLMVKNKVLILFSLIFFLSTLAIFFVSTYKLNAYGFENRTLGLVRFSFSILFVFFCFIFIKGKSVMVSIFCQILVMLYLSVSVITIIAEKNAWLLAEKYNIDIVQTFLKNIPENLSADNIFVSYDKSDKDFFVADEPTLEADYEFAGLLAKEHSPKRYTMWELRKKTFHIGSFFCKKVNNREKEILQFEKNGDLIHKKIKLPCYIFDYESEVFYYIENKNDYKSYLNTVN